MRVYEKSVARLAPLLGADGVGALFRRSATLTKHPYPCFADPAVIESSTSLRACLLGLDPAIAPQAAAMLFATFFELLETFIGPRLTNQVLRRTWPALAEAATEETKP